MTNYLVTGGAGFIGSHIVAALLQRGDQVRVLDNFSTGSRANLAGHPDIDLIVGDIRDTEAVGRAVKGMDYIIHQAALVSVTQSMAEPLTTHHINVDGTLNILTAALAHNVKRVVMASSCAVYGDNDDLPLRETSLPKPMSPYAASKLIGEVYCQMFSRAYGLSTVCLRYFNVYGPRQDPDGEYAAVIPKFAQRMKNNQAPIIYGEGTQTRDFVHVGDIVRANLRSCECDAAIGQIFNVASGSRTSLLNLIDAMNNLLGTDIKGEHAPARDGDIKHSLGDATLIATALGFKPDISLVDGLRTIVRPEAY